MSKYTTEFKLKIVEHYLQTNCSKKSLARKFKVSRRDVQKWIALYENQGEAGLVSTYTNYTEEFKLDVLNYMNEHRTSIRETAAIFNIPAPSMLLQWKKLLDTYGIDALEQKKKAIGYLWGEIANLIYTILKSGQKYDPKIHVAACGIEWDEMYELKDKQETVLLN